MSQVNFSSASISKIITHHVGSKFHGEEIELSSECSVIKEYSRELLIDYLLKPIVWDQYYSFGEETERKNHPFLSGVEQVFADPESLVEVSKEIAQHLYECADHSNIKSGELNCVVYDRLEFEGKQVKAFGLFKSTDKKAFIQLDKQGTNYLISHKHAYPIKGVDKACLIIETGAENEYRIYLYDNTSTGSVSKYWERDFCKVSVCKNEFHATAAVMNMTRNFLTEQLDEDFEVSSPDKIDLMNKSAAYFKTNDQFDRNDFEKEVFEDENVINSFRDYNEKQGDFEKLVMEDQFDISKTAVKKNAKVFKSILKLDKNFHIYIHGNRNLIEQGQEEDGRKFYKVFYNEES